MNDLVVGEHGSMLVLSSLLTLGDQGVGDVADRVLDSEAEINSTHTAHR